MARTVEDVLTHAAIRGDRIEKTVDDMMKSVNEAVPRWQMERLIRTESAYMATAAQLDLFGDLGADSAKFLATLDEKACGSCGSLDGTIIPLDDARAGRTVPPVHPNCRCVLVPIWSHDKDNPKLKSAYRAARDPETGKTVDVPYMNYEQWKSAFLDGKAEKVRPMSGAEAAWTAYAETAVGPDAGIPYKNILKDADGRPLVDDRPFTTIGSAKELEAFMRKNSRMSQDPTWVEVKAIYDYTVDSSDMNAFCRVEGGSFIGDDAPSLESLLEEKSGVSLLDSVIAKSVLLQNLVTYRAISMKHSFPGKKNVSEIVGMTYTDDAFMSSTPLFDVAVRIADQRGTDALLRMKVHAGAGKGLYVNEYSDKKGVEYEFLLARKGKYIVESYDYVQVNGKTYTIITVSEST